MMKLFDPSEKRSFVAVIFSALLMAFFQALGILSILPFMTLVMNPDAIYDNRWLHMIYSALGFTDELSFITFTGFVMLAVIILGSAVTALATWLRLRFVWRNNHKMATALLKKYLSLPYIYFLGHHSSDLSKNVLDEVSQFTSKFLLPMVVFITIGLKVALIMATIIIVDPLVTILAVIILGGSYALIYKRFRRGLLKGGEIRLLANRGRYKAANEAFGGIKDIKVMRREPFFLRRFIKHSQKLSDMHAWEAVVGALPKYAMEATAFGGVIALVLILLYVQGSAHQLIPMVAVFAIAGYRLMPALQEVFKAATQVQFSRAVLNRLYKDMTEENTVALISEDTDIELPEPLPFREEIELKNITFFYPNTDEPVLKDINLKIKRHNSIAVAGPTGSGKTTLVDIILGLLTPQQGTISIDGTVITEHNLPNWQRNIGYVPQHIFLSDDTLARNIAFGIPDREIDRQALEKAAKLANLYDFITEELPRGFETIVGERGVRLSGGQRQRVGIARALYYDPEILVLDEATSALDGITEDAVLEAIENASKLKTMIIIAHRLTTVMNCDTIYLMNKGRIEAQGTYDELVDTNIQFRAMAKAAEK